MKEVLKNALKDHVVDNKLDLYGAFLLAMWLLDLNIYFRNIAKEVMSELGIKGDIEK